MNGQIPLTGAGNRLCKLTFPPSRAGAARVSYDFPAESGISGAAKDKHKFPRSGPDFRKVSIGKWNAHREGAVDAKSNRFGQPRANVMQKTDLTRQPLLALHVFWKSLWLFWLDFVQGSASNTCFLDEKTQRSAFAQTHPF